MTADPHGYHEAEWEVTADGEGIICPGCLTEGEGDYDVDERIIEALSREAAD